MNLAIRSTVIENVKDNNTNQLESTITDAIEKQDEHLLPGLGVLFELIWQQSSEDDRQHLLDQLHTRLNA